MRIIKSFYELDCNVEEVKNLANNIRSYEEFKDLKYLLQCAKQLSIAPEMVFRDFPGVTKNINDIRKNLIEAICCYRNKDMHTFNALDKILHYKMDPVQIDYITDTLNDFSDSDIKHVAIGILNGLTLEEITAANNQFNNGVYKTLQDAISSVTAVKFYDISNIDKEMEIKSDWFDEINEPAL